MGKPSNLSPFEEDFLRGCSEMEYTLPQFIGKDATVEVTLEPDEVVYLEIKKKEDADVLFKSDMNLEENLRTY